MTASLASGDSFRKSVVFLNDKNTWGSSWGTWRSWRGTGRLREQVTSRAKIVERTSLIATSVLTTLPAGRNELVIYCLRPWSCVERKWVRNSPPHLKPVSSCLSQHVGLKKYTNSPTYCSSHNYWRESARTSGWSCEWRTSISTMMKYSGP
jgi:hypothetical protein